MQAQTAGTPPAPAPTGAPRRTGVGGREAFAYGAGNFAFALLGLVGLVLATILPSYLVHVYGGREGYGFMGAILGLGTAAFLALSASVPERAEFQGRPPLGPFAGWIATLSNPHFFRILIAFATATSAGCWWLSDGTILLFTALLVFGGASFGNYVALPASIVADLIDWDEARTGLRREASYFALWAFATKFGSAFTGWAALLTFRFERGDLDAAQRAVGRG